MNIFILSAVSLLNENILSFISRKVFSTWITHLSHIRDTSCNKCVRKKDHVPAKFDPYCEMYLYVISEVRTQGTEGKVPLKCSEIKRSSNTQMEVPFALHFPSLSLSLLRQTITVALRPIFYRKTHKWKHPNLGNLILVTSSMFPKGHLKTPLFVPSD